MTVEQRKSNLRTLNPVTATTREVSEVLNRTINGGLNSVGYAVLAGGTTTTTVSDPRYGVDSIVFFTGYNETLEHSYPFVKSTSTNGSMIIEHKNHGHDVDVAYLIIG